MGRCVPGWAVAAGGACAARTADENRTPARLTQALTYLERFTDNSPSDVVRPFCSRSPTRVQELPEAGTKVRLATVGHRHPARAPREDMDGVHAGEARPSPQDTRHSSGRRHGRDIPP